MPSNSTEHRRLAAIMFTDMVGYSALSQRNEMLALELLDEHRELLRSIFPKHQGREIKSTGDGFLVEFASALAAVQCAMEIQQLMRQHNAPRPAERRVLIRIGIHLGDVVEREKDVFGDGVNIAARIEPLAEPGGICVSRAVYEQIENKVDHPLMRLSKPALKNIQATVEVYRLLLDEVRPQRSARRSSRSPMMIAGIAVLLAALSAVAFLMFRPRPAAPVVASNVANSNPAPRAAESPAAIPLTVELHVLHSFGPTNVEGSNPWGAVALTADGWLYGCTVNGGSGGGGSLYRLRTNGSDYAVLHQFEPARDGTGPTGVIEGHDGALYGVTPKGGAQELGVIFRSTRDGDFRVLHHFAISNDFRSPQATLLEARDGFLYGVAAGGNGSGLGPGGVFRIARDGSGYEVVARFGPAQTDNPRQPMGGLVQGADGTFYGTSRLGGANSNGTVFRVESGGKFTVLKSFGGVTNSMIYPTTALLLASDGLLYGTCSLGSSNSGGALFRLATNGTGFQPRQFAINEARELVSPLIEAADGSLLGVSLTGGPANQGAVFRINKGGRGYSSVHDFRAGNEDGARARTPLTPGGPGIFYGATASGGSHWAGTVFQLTIPELARAPAAAPGRR